MPVLLNYPLFHADDDNGAPLTGGLLYSYIAGTSTAKATYTTRAMTTANANPVVLNSRGEAVIYGSGLYKLILKTSAGVTIWTQDNVEMGPGQGAYSFFVNPSETDQGVASSGASLYDILTALGTSKKATVYFPHSGTAATTTYTVSTTFNAAAYTNVSFVFENGAILSVATGITLTLPSPASIVASPNQQIFSGAGTVLFNGPGTVYPEWWGVDGTADNVQIQAAINSLSLGGTVKLTGYYYIAATITINQDHENIHILGDSPESTILYGVGATVNIMTIAGTALDYVAFIIVENICFSRDTVSPTTGVALKVSYTQLSTFYNLMIYHSYVGISISDASYCSFSDIGIERSGGTNMYGVYIDGSDDGGLNHNNPSNHYVNIHVAGTGVAGSRIGFEITGARWNDNSFERCEVYQCEYGMLFIHSTDTIVNSYDVHINNCILDDIFTAGIYADGGMSLQIAGNWIYTNHLTANATDVNRAIYLQDCVDCSVVGNTCLTGNISDATGIGYGTGIELNNTNGTMIVGNTFRNFRLPAVFTDSDYNTISANEFRMSSGATSALNIVTIATSDHNILSSNIGKGLATVGVNIGAGCTSNLITFNNLSDTDITTKIVNAGTTTKVRLNIGYVTQNSGYLAVTSGVAFPHGLADTPLFVTVQPVQTGVTDCYVSATDATNITVTYTGAAGKYFFWKANTALDP